MSLRDQIDMPDYNPEANKGRGDWGLRNVSEGTVKEHPRDIVACEVHGAMNSVSSQRTLWRCLACGRAAYRARKLCKQVLHRERNEHVWHFHYFCESAECQSPQCQHLREQFGIHLSARFFRSAG